MEWSRCYLASCFAAEEVVLDTVNVAISLHLSRRFSNSLQSYVLFGPCATNMLVQRTICDANAQDTAKGRVDF
jgi:hypothetical protein